MHEDLGSSRICPQWIHSYPAHGSSAGAICDRSATDAECAVRSEQHHFGTKACIGRRVDTIGQFALDSNNLNWLTPDPKTGIIVYMLQEPIQTGNTKFATHNGRDLTANPGQFPTGTLTVPTINANTPLESII